MRVTVTSLVFLAALVAFVLVHVPRAHAGSSQPQALERVTREHAPIVSSAGAAVRVAGLTS